jgi:DsbC/DsbD-like thiol-disulfide interchange protein/cytochrome c biogenesis protein CcdA
MRLFAILLSLLVFSAAHANTVQRDHIEAELIPATTSVQPGQPLTLALRLKMETHWHTYWKNPGDSGLATRIHWTLPAGFEAGDIQWPAPKRIDVGPLANYGYEGEVLLLTDIRTPPDFTGGMVPVAARADWLVCEEICIPGDAEFSLMLPVGPADPNPKWAARIAQTRAALPRPDETISASATLAGNEWVLTIPRATAPRLARLQFFPDQEGWIDYASKQQLQDLGDRWQLRFAAAPGMTDDGGRLTGLLAAEPGFAGGATAVTVSLPYATAAALPPMPVDGGSGSLTLWLALGLALVGGLLLNLMPCVFPVVGIKVLTFVENSRSSPASLRAHGLLFALGVLLCFWMVAGVLLGLRAGGAALGWGYQLQSPLVVSALALLFFAVALNLSGVYEFGLRAQQLAGSIRAESGYLDAFLSGLLATIVATPCTAPFMGVALGFALTQPPAASMLVFTALALGMAAPYLLLSFSPRLVQKLPKPGPWMETLKQVLAFPLYLTAVWLVWVLGRQAGVDAVAKLLVGITLVGAALWTFGRWRVAPRRGVRAAAFASALLLAAGGLVTAWPTAIQTGNASAAAGEIWQPWSRSAVAQAQARGQTAFVDFTAAWCVTCQVNKRLVLSRDSVVDGFKARNIALLRADWTNQDPEITAALKELGRSGVPVYVFYPANGGAPLLLPEVLTESRVLEALDQVAATRTAAAK